MQLRQKVGWSPEEIRLLQQVVGEASRQGQPLRNAFDDVAKKTGRKSNSVRNHYYAICRKGEITMAAPAVRRNPAKIFSQAEIHHMLCQILSAISKGVSVRRATLDLAQGDQGQALRFQNKYRSILRTQPQWIHEIADELSVGPKKIKKQSNVTPLPASKRAPQEEAQDMVRIVSEIMTDLKKVENIDSCAFLETIARLVSAAATQNSARRKALDYDALSARYDVALLALEDRDAEIARLKGQA